MKLMIMLKPICVILFIANLLGCQSNPSPNRPLFDTVFEPILGEVGTIKFFEEQVNTVGAQLNQQIDFIHDTDHGVRICNQEQGPYDHGACFTADKCNALGGVPVGSCQAPTTKTTCCKFPRTCGQSSTESVTYVKSDPSKTTENCDVTIKTRLGACQLRVDFLEFDLPKPFQSGVCSPNNSLEIVQTGLKPFVFGKGNSFFCGVNSGNHFYLPITKRNELIHFKLRNSAAQRPYNYNIRITQVDCRSGLAEMRALRAPDGCTQWFTSHRGGLASYNYDGTAPISPAQTYSACFNSTPSCALALQEQDFRLGTDAACHGPGICGCERAYLTMNLAEDLDANLLAKDRFCGVGLGLQGGDPPLNRPLFDRVFEPVLGEIGTVKFIEEQVNTIGGQINHGIDFIHDTDHGSRICNLDQPFNQGVCFKAFTCGALGGVDVGTCSTPTPKSTCCKFTRTCGQSSAETVTYFSSEPTKPVRECEVIIKSRSGACQFRVDFLEFDLPKPHESGVCFPNKSLEIFHPGLKRFVFGKGNSFFCGMNSGNHFYLPITRRNEEIRFRFRNADSSQSFKYAIRVTQVDCRSRLDDMLALRAPDGCTQWFTKPRGGLASYNYDGMSRIAPAQEYTACFNATSACALAFEERDFRLGTDVTCHGPGTCVCRRAYLALPLAEDLDARLLSKDRFCGVGLGLNRGILVTRSRPFILRVHTGTELSPRNDAGFLFVYNLIDKC
ncbi:hypothetical protein TCAL_11893 [Tigriopus californicus]|uniref:CUB domain-containing protein n=1 Tax=Tigriopus californicus TaxID=6832 RepID=A0A553PJY4_TIGCA|nr:hypothetical protein TCAL_11893 [Tigriopus californicus]